MIPKRFIFISDYKDCKRGEVHIFDLFDTTKQQLVYTYKTRSGQYKSYWPKSFLRNLVKMKIILPF